MKELAPETARERRIARTAYMRACLRHGASRLAAEHDAMIQYPVPSVTKPRTAHVGHHQYRVVENGIIEYRRVGLGYSPAWEPLAEHLQKKHRTIAYLLANPTDTRPGTEEDEEV